MSTNSRPKAPFIRPVPDDAPWILLSRAAQASGLSELIIRKEGLPLRRFGNAHYVRPKDLNNWILDGHQESSRA